MTHWRRGSNITSPHCDENCTLSYASKKQGHAGEEVDLLVEKNVRDKVQLFTICRNESSEFLGDEKVRIQMGGSTLIKDVERFDEMTFSPNPEHISFDKNHFPMYEINRKMESIFNPKTGPPHVQVISRDEFKFRLRERTLDVAEFAARRVRRTAVQEIKPLKSVDGSKSFQHELTSLTYQSATRKFEERPNMMVSNDIKDKKFSSMSDHIFDEHPVLKADLAALKQELCNFAGPLKFADSETKDDSEVATVNGCLLSRIKSGDMQEVRDSKIEKNNMDLLRHSSNDRSNLFIHNVRNSDMGITMHMEWSAQKKLILDSKQTANAKGTALFEMLTLPTTSSFHGRQHGEVKPLVNSSRMVDGENGTHTIGRRGDSSVQTATITGIDAFRTNTSLEGMNSGGLQKDLMCPNPIKFHHPSASLIKQTARQHSTVSNNACIGDGELNTPKTDSMNVDEVPPHILIKPNTSNFVDIVENSTRAKHCDRCLKRLNHEPTDVCGLGVKRMKIGDGPASTEICSLLAVNKYECAEEQRIIDKTIHSPSAPELSFAPAPNDAQHWVRRWYHKPQKPKAKENVAKSKLCDSEHLKVVHENFDGKQFPSIRALALMGRAMNNFQVGGFHRMGSSVVWRNVEEI